MCVHVCFFIFLSLTAGALGRQGMSILRMFSFINVLFCFTPTLETYVCMTIIFGDSSKLSNY